MMIRIGRGSGKWNMMMEEIKDLINKDFTVFINTDEQAHHHKDNLVLIYYMNAPYKGFIRGTRK